MSEYDLDALRAAVEQTRRGPLLLGRNPHQDKADALNYSQSLDSVRQSLLIAARSTLLTDAALGRALRAAAERDGLERETMGAAMWGQPANVGVLSKAAAAALIAFVEANDGR